MPAVEILTTPKRQAAGADVPRSSGRSSPEACSRRRYAPAWPGLGIRECFRAPAAGDLPFPFSAPNTAFSYLARNLIYHLVKAVRPAGGPPVLVPEYHHGNEVAAIRAAGAAVRFYRINRALEPDMEEIARLARDGSRVLVLIHYLGWAQKIEEIAEFCRRREMILIEDCALSLLSEARGRPLGSFGDYSVFCLYKSLPVPNGGLLVQNRAPLGALERLEVERCSLASVAGRCAELFLGRTRSRHECLGRGLFAAKRAVGAALGALRVARVPVGDTGFVPGRANLGMSSFSRRMLARLDYRRIRERRRRNFLLMRGRLAGRAILLPRELEEGMCPLFFPILVPDKDAAVRRLASKGIEAVPFWNRGDPEADRQASDDVRFLRRHLLELPIHQDLSPDHVHFIADQVLNLDLRIPGEARGRP